ncbi:TRML2 protein, partial [Picathartes gymnocephalus]|nr:TRML2 protein [Picathartes gymnocephalus]
LQGQTSETQRRREGDTLHIQCPYPAWVGGSETKYWCHLTDERCPELVRTYYEHMRQSRDGKIKIKDDSTARTVSINMTDLKAENSGTYLCVHYSTGNVIKTISLNVYKAHVLAVFQGPSSTQPRSQATSLSDGNTFIVLSVVLLILLLLALLTSTALGVRLYRLLARTGNREAEDTSDRPEGTAQPGRRESSQDDRKGPAYINLNVQPHPSPEDPLYCNVEPSQAHRNSQHVEYTVIAFNQPPRNNRE